MSKKQRPADQPVRGRIVAEFGRNFLVEAGAGSGKTYSLAMRMAAGIEAGHYTVEHMAAVTFTRKAAAELRGRFQLALEERLRAAPSAVAAQRLETALSGIERLFAGTIHAFCAHLLRERPVDARVAPGFTELDDAENARQRERAWRNYVGAARARGSEPMLELLDAGLRPKDLDEAFGAVCEHEDVTFDMGRGEPPELEPILKEVERFWRALGKLKPDEFPEETTCKVQLKYDEFTNRLGALRRNRRMAQLGSLLTWWNKASVVQKWWAKDVGREASVGKAVKGLVDAFQADIVDPFIVQWQAYLHRLAMVVLIDARDGFARDRRRLNVVNYVDLLRVTGNMLRSNGEVRRALQQKYCWLFVDEFQDTDPIQAEIFLMLAGAEEQRVAVAQDSSPAIDPFALALRPGALFVVGDPKQSIFRFRRADIDIYNRVARRIVDTGGEVLSLTANFRSLPAVCELANTVFPRLFAASPAPYSPQFEALDPVRDASDVRAKGASGAGASERRGGSAHTWSPGASPRLCSGQAAPGSPAPSEAEGPKALAGVATLPIPSQDDRAAMVAAEAALVASYVHAEVTSGRRTYGDFLVITRLKPRLGVYAEGFDAIEIPMEVSGAGLFCKSPDVRALASLLAALADPLDSVALVGVLRGPLFGVSDPELFQYRQAGGRFELNVPLPESADGKGAKALDARYGPALPAMRQVREMLHLARRLPLAGAIDAILDMTGWLALAGTTPGGARAGHLLQAIDMVRHLVESGGGLADAAEALNDDEQSSESEALPLEPGRRDVVRLMNLHKAKGLEAPVVILADPLHTFEFPIYLRVERDGGSARGHLRLVRKNPNGFGAKTLAQPSDWEAHETEEKKYVAAEGLRLLYVAGTRAKDLLIVCRSENAKDNKAWREFEWYLNDMPELEVLPATPVAGELAADLSPKARAASETERAARHDAVRVESWTVTSPTGEKSRLAAIERALEVMNGARGPAAAALPDTASHRVDGGAAWGSLLHGLLEHAMRHMAATRDDLARLAQWLTVENPDLRPFIPEALEWVDEVRQLPFWKDAAAGEVRHVEVPFAVRLSPADAARGLQPPGSESGRGRPALLRGVIDLVYESGDGWRILDYKSDQLDGIVDVDAWLLAHYGPQLAQYRVAWERVSGARVASAELVALREKRTIGVG